MALEAAMTGRRRGDQASLFYEFRLDDRIPKDHLLRRIDGFVTAALADVHERPELYYSETDVGHGSDSCCSMRVTAGGIHDGVVIERAISRFATRSDGGLIVAPQAIGPV